MEIGYELGLVHDQTFKKFQAKRERVDGEIHRLKRTYPKPTRDSVGRGASPEMDPGQNNISLGQLLRRPELTYRQVLEMIGEISKEAEEIIEAIEVSVKYEGYIRRQEQEVAKFKKLENRRIPVEFDYDVIKGFSHEVAEKLKKVKPSSIGQASRISGITPAAISLLLVALDRSRRSNEFTHVS